MEVVGAVEMIEVAGVVPVGGVGVFWLVLVGELDYHL
jgi:hypothetical protein